MPTGVAICSLLLNSGADKYNIFILEGEDVDAEDRQRLTMQVNTLSPESRISFISMGNIFDGGYEIRGISKACYYRLMIPWILPDLEKVIYCDGDVIIKTPLSSLYKTEIEKLYVAGGETNTPEGWESMKSYFDKLNLDYRTYINSGVLVINCELQRRNGLDKVYNSLSKKKFLYQDQDIINIACKGKIGHFSNRYNLLPSKYATSKELTENVVIHYAGDKPWNGFTYAWKEWWNVYEKSVFWDREFYHQVSASILSPKKQLKRLKRKALDKIKQTWTKI